MLKRLFTHCMIRPADIRPTSDTMRVVGVLNPGAAAFGDGVALLVRVVEEPVEQREGYIASPRLDEGKGLVIDWLKADEYNTDDPRLVTHKKTGALRLRFFSYLKVVHSHDGRTADNVDGPVIPPVGPYEIYGIEDPRITLIGTTYYVTYVAVSAYGICTSLISTVDFKSFRRHGVIFCPDNKDVVLFPEKVMNEYVSLHRPNGQAKFSPPEMWLARSPDLVHWGTHTRLLGATGQTMQDRIGGGTPPIRTPEGWLSVYHRSEKSKHKDAVGIYTGYTMMQDLDNPAVVSGLSSEPVMSPTEKFETKGYVDNVVFPTGIVERGEAVLIYYGAADECVGVTAFEREALIGSAMTE